MTIQIIGQNLDLGLKELSVKGIKMYESKANEYGSKFQVWQLTDSEYDKLSSVKESDWQSDYGWWRNTGCNHPLTFFKFNVNGENMVGFKNEYHWYHSEDCLAELEEDETEEVPPYSSFSEWFSEYMELSKPENLAYFAHSLAQHNGMTNAEFFKKFEG